MIPSIALTGEQKNKLIKAVKHPPVAPDFALAGFRNPKLRVFVANFDGTQNDKYNVPSGERRTLVAANSENITTLAPPGVESRYYKGVGTEAGLPITSIVQSATGMGCLGNANKAFEDFKKQAIEWLKEDPEAVIHVHAVGFSRGSATALHFLNMVDAIKREPADPALARGAPESRLGRMSIQSSAVLLDTVSTGQGENLNLTVPPSCVAALHLVAENEQRPLFPLREIAVDPELETSMVHGASMPGATPDENGVIHYKRIHEIRLPGVHSDIGGSYKDGGIAEVSSYLMDVFQQSLGFELKPKKPTVESMLACRMHDSRFGIERYLNGEKMPQAPRLAQKAQKDRWQGFWGIKGQVESFLSEKVEAGSATVIGEKPSPGEPEPEINKAIGKSFSMQIMKAGVENPFSGQAFEIEGKGVKVSVFGADLPKEMKSLLRVEEDGIYLGAIKIPGTPSLAALEQGWGEASVGPAMSFKSVGVKVETFRVGSLASCERPGEIGPRQLPAAAGDPWPDSTRKALAHLLENPPANARQAEKFMELAAKALAAQMLEENPRLDKVSIKKLDAPDNGPDADGLSARFAVEGSDLDGRRYSSTLIDFKNGKKDRMQELARSVGAVARLLAVQGYVVAPEASYVFERDRAAALSGKPRMAMSGQAEPRLRDFGRIQADAKPDWLPEYKESFSLKKTVSAVATMAIKKVMGT